MAAPVYADHAADTPIRPAAVSALAGALDVVGNPSSAHGTGQSARRLVEEARESIAAAIGTVPGDVVLTSGGTEADNLAVKGIVWAARGTRPVHVVTTAVEHVAVLEPLRWLAERGEVELDLVMPSRDGRVEVDAVLDLVRDETVLVSVMAANNVTGAVNDVPALGAALADHGAALHVDAVQAMHLGLDVAAWGADAIALSAHKFGGPVGVGLATLRRGVPVTPLLHGGGQDRGVRSGTLSASLAVALAAAVEAAVADRAAEAARLRELTDRVRAGAAELEGVELLGPADPAWRLPGHVALALRGVHADALVFALDRAGVHASVGPACSSGANAGNPVLEAMGVDADAGLRLSLGWTSTVADAERISDVLTDVVPILRAAGGGFVTA